MTTGKLWQLAARPGMPSQPTIRRLIREHRDFPVIQHGRKGCDYVIDLDAAARFVEALQVPGRGRPRKAVAPDPSQPSFLEPEQSR